MRRHNIGPEGGARTIRLSESPRRRSLARAFDTSAKRSLDVLVAAALLCVLSPLILVVLVAIALESRGSLFYRARRVGYRGREFPMLKFRKMKSSANGLPLTLSDDDRFTRIGRFLAASKLDELPQLWNVVKGQMSLVGPRPEDPCFVAVVPDDYEVVTRVRPGITGLTQLAFARESEILETTNCVDYYVSKLLHQKVQLDRLYVETRTLAMDLRILFWTGAAVVLRRPVAVNRASGHMNVRRRPKPTPESAPAVDPTPALEQVGYGDA